MLSLTLATFSVDKKVHWMSDLSIFKSEKEKEDDFQPTMKHTKPSAPKGKQRSKLKCYCWKSISKGLCSENTDDTVGSFDVQWIVLCVKSA